MVEAYQTAEWNAAFPEQISRRAVSSLERGNVLFFPNLAFILEPAEERFLSPDCADGKAKNISFDPASGTIRGTRHEGSAGADLRGMMARFARSSRIFLEYLIPGYAPHLQPGRTSYRPVEVKGRPSSYKKDDTRLHVDAFASRPNHGDRILRVFTNVNPKGEPRVWDLGEPFEDFVEKFAPRTSRQWPGSAWLLERFHVTKGVRTPYDHIMLQLHDRAKQDTDYQRAATKTRVPFPPGSTWVVFSDRVLHAALAGQYLLEQTFLLPVIAMDDQRLAPLRILERLRGQELA